MGRPRYRRPMPWPGSIASAGRAGSTSAAPPCCCAPATSIVGAMARPWRRWHSTPIDGSGRSLMEFQDIRAVTEAIREEVRKAVVGQDDAIDLMLTSLLVGGHVLLEGVPGTAKTLLAQAFAAALTLKFGRIQFTPDLMPGDVLGTNLFNFHA